MKKNVFLSAVLLVAGLVLLQGCDWFGGSSETSSRNGEFVVKLGGKTVVTADEFRQYLDMYKQSQPMLDQILPGLPEEQQRMFYNQIVDMQANGALIKKYADAEGWTSTPEYKNTARRLHDEIDRNLALMEFQKKIAAEYSPTEAQMVEFYNSNKLTNPYLQNAPYVAKQGGVQAVAVKAKDEAQAKALVTAGKRGLKKAAAEMGLKVDDLGIVNQQSTQPDRMIVFKLLSAKDFPMVDMAQVGTTWWVFEAVAKKDSVYADYDKLPAQAQEQLKSIMSNDHLQKAFQEKLGQLKEKADYKLEINTPFVEALIVKQEQPAQAAPAQA